MIHYDHDSFPQGGEAWIQCRVGKITASRAKDARDTLKSGKPSAKQTAYAAQVAVERIAGKPIDKTFQSWQMKEGNEQEPIARRAYEARTGNLVEEVGAIATDDDCFLYSPDGLIDDDGLLEIKCLFSPERILEIVASGDHSDFIDQCMFGLWLTGRKWIDLVIWVPSLDHMVIKRITRDENAIEALEADMIAFSKIVKANEDALRSALALNNQN